jgi:hypothetical protein
MLNQCQIQSRRRRRLLLLRVHGRGLGDLGHGVFLAAARLGLARPEVLRRGGAGGDGSTGSVPSTRRSLTLGFGFASAASSAVQAPPWRDVKWRFSWARACADRRRRRLATTGSGFGATRTIANGVPTGRALILRGASVVPTGHALI